MSQEQWTIPCRRLIISNLRFVRIFLQLVPIGSRSYIYIYMHENRNTDFRLKQLPTLFVFLVSLIYRLTTFCDSKHWVKSAAKKRIRKRKKSEANRKKAQKKVLKISHSHRINLFRCLSKSVFCSSRLKASSQRDFTACPEIVHTSRCSSKSSKKVSKRSCLSCVYYNIIIIQFLRILLIEKVPRCIALSVH